MRLKKEQIHKISEIILKDLKTHQLARFKISEEKIYSKISEIITLDLQNEDRLDDEVRKLMERFQQQIASGQMDRQKVFQMIKKQLIKERNLVI